jgi:ribosome-associated heat shock protein Hsp15
MRLDVWLWAVRIYKTRTLATQAIRGGHVKIAGMAVKPAREVRPGEVIAARVQQMTRTVRVLAAPAARIGAKLVAQFLEELTPPQEYARRREASLLPPGFRPRGAGRPTKQQRRAHDRTFEL